MINNFEDKAIIIKKKNGNKISIQTSKDNYTLADLFDKIKDKIDDVGSIEFKEIVVELPFDIAILKELLSMQSYNNKYIYDFDRSHIKNYIRSRRKPYANDDELVRIISNNIKLLLSMQLKDNNE